MAVYVRARQHNSTIISMSLESAIITNVYRIAGNGSLHLKIQLMPVSESDSALIRVDMTRISYEIVEKPPEIADFCVWPVIVDGSYVIAGLCSVSRALIKASTHKKVNKLLGFRDSCLMACSEASIWTKFCEVDMVSTIKALLEHPDKFYDAGRLRLPPDFARFEYHLSRPVRIHNVYKIAREKHHDKDIKSSVPIAELNLSHTFSEGPFMTLSDAILFPCYQVFLQMYPVDAFRARLPLSLDWFDALIDKNVNKLKLELSMERKNVITELVEPDFAKQSLYSADPNRYRPEKRVYTKQNDIVNSLRIINNNRIEIANGLYPFGEELAFDWGDIPAEASPMGGALPAKRANRKCEQLENLAKAVIKLATDVEGGRGKLKIVDFCSGSGHLGILLACLLPDNQVILVENKENSLQRAKERIANLKLSNLVVLQSNLDYFVGSFDIGVSLHACGVATDLVIENCLRNRAHFVCCPCCYGGIHDCYHLTYPRSEEYAGLEMDLKDYLTLAHAADQTHDAENRKTTQGFVCMDAIDTDRRLYAERKGYEVHLGKLQPPSCTNKNNLLVGVYTDRIL